MTDLLERPMLRLLPAGRAAVGEVVRVSAGRSLWVSEGSSRARGKVRLRALSGVARTEVPWSSAVAEVTCLEDLAVVLGRAAAGMSGWAEQARLSLDGEHVAVDLVTGVEVSAPLTRVVEAWEALCAAGVVWEVPAVARDLSEVSIDDAVRIVRVALGLDELEEGD